jgi:hypothetical protein
LWETQEQTGEAFVQYFNVLFTAEGSSNRGHVVEAMETRVTRSMNELLLKEFTVEEVGAALNKMSPLKAPGLDGFSASFYQKNWATIGVEVSNAVIHILNNGSLNKDMNLTYITLIPKIANPSCVI